MSESLETALIGLSCFILGNYVGNILHDQQSYIDALWCMVSALVVLPPDANITKGAKERIFGTVIGSLIAGVVCILLGYGYYSIMLSIGLCVFVLNILKYPAGIRIATVTATVITGYGFIQPEYSPLINSIMRSIDTFIGVLFSLLTVYISYKLRIRKQMHRNKQST